MRVPGAGPRILTQKPGLLSRIPNFHGYGGDDHRPAAGACTRISASVGAPKLSQALRAVPFVPPTDPTTEVRLPAVGNAARSAAVTRTYGSRPSGTPALNASP